MTGCQVPGPREVISKLTVLAQDILKFNGSLLDMRAVMLTGVTGDDIFRIAVARHFGKLKPSSNVPFEADIICTCSRTHHRRQK
jgi:hypothetical protein